MGGVAGRGELEQGLGAARGPGPVQLRKEYHRDCFALFKASLLILDLM